MHTAFLLLGSNLGDRRTNLKQAIGLLKHAGEVIGSSGVYETAPWGHGDQPAFLNQAVSLRTLLEPEALLHILKSMETEIGRKATYTWGPREIDVDILAIDQLVHQSDKLTVPHPRLAERRFALVPLMEIAPDLPVPGTGTDVKGLLLQCADPLQVIPADC